jgi:hypothetical protein
MRMFIGPWSLVNVAYLGRMESIRTRPRAYTGNERRGSRHGDRRAERNAGGERLCGIARWRAVARRRLRRWLDQDQMGHRRARHCWRATGRRGTASPSPVLSRVLVLGRRREPPHRFYGDGKWNLRSAMPGHQWPATPGRDNLVTFRRMPGRSTSLETLT